MHIIKLHDHGGQRTYSIVFEAGDEPMTGLRALAREHGWRASRFTALGAFSDAVLAYFNWESKEYERIPVDEQVEVLSLVGDISVAEETPKVHAHVTLGRRDGVALGGHLMSAHVRPTLELMLVDAPARLERRRDADSGLDLIAAGVADLRAR